MSTACHWTEQSSVGVDTIAHLRQASLFLVPLCSSVDNMDFWYFLMVLQIACFVTSATSVPIAMPMVDDVQDQDQM